MIDRTDKPWGHELLFARTSTYAGKILFIRAGEALSLQYHERKEETIYVQSGRLLLEVGAEGAASGSGAPVDPLRRVELGPGGRWHLPPRTVHRFMAEEDTTLFEVSSPELHDVVRLEDRYGRAGTSQP